MTDASGRHAGVELGTRGWDQGSLLAIPLAEMSFLRVEDTTGEWVHASKAIGENDQLVVVSQVCDIVKNPMNEPYVEAARAFWSSDRGLIHSAKRNSIRHFWLKQRVNIDSVVEALIADTTFRIYLRKEDLLSATPTDGFADGDRDGRVRFRRWLGARYNRQPIPDSLVIAVQQPIVDGLAKLRDDDPLWSTLEGISEILFLTGDDREPYRIEMVFLLSEDKMPPVAETELDRLGGWVARHLKKVGKAVLNSQVTTDLRSISAYDYATLYQLPLDQYSLPEIAS